MESEHDRIEALAEAVANAQPYFDEPSRRVALATYRRLAQGTPAPADVAEGAGESVDLVERLLRSWPGVFRDDRGDVAGFWGLTIDELVPTHAIEVEGRRLFAWCAWDTLFLPAILGTEARVESMCPVTGQTISLVVRPEGVAEISHAQAVVSFVLRNTPFPSLAEERT